VAAALQEALEAHDHAQAEVKKVLQLVEEGRAAVAPVAIFGGPASLSTVEGGGAGEEGEEEGGGGGGGSTRGREGRGDGRCEGESAVCQR